MVDVLNGVKNWALSLVELLPDLKRFYLRRLSGLSREEVDDLVQETFSRALATTTDLGDLDLRTYVFGIAGKIFLDLMRRQYRSGAFVAGQIHEKSVALSYVESDDTWVAKWISSKSPKQQEVLVRRVYFEDSQREAAQSLGITYQKVRTMEARLREELKRDLSETPSLKARQGGKARQGKARQGKARGKMLNFENCLTQNSPLNRLYDHMTMKTLFWIPAATSLAVSVGLVTAAACTLIVAIRALPTRRVIVTESAPKLAHHGTTTGGDASGKIGLVPAAVVTSNGRELIEYHADVDVGKGTNIGAAWETDVIDDRGILIHAKVAVGNGKLQEKKRAKAGPISVDLTDPAAGLRGGAHFTEQALSALTQLDKTV